MIDEEKKEVDTVTCPTCGHPMRVQKNHCPKHDILFDQSCFRCDEERAAGQTNAGEPAAAVHSTTTSNRPPWLR